MIIDKLIISMMSFIILDTIQIISIFSSIGIYFNIFAFLMLILLSFLKVNKSLTVEYFILIPVVLLITLSFNVSFSSNLGLSKSLAILSTAFLIFFNRTLFEDESNIRLFLTYITGISVIKLVSFLMFVNVSFIELLTNPSQTRFVYSLYFNPIYLARSCGLGLLAVYFMDVNNKYKIPLFLFLLLGVYISGSRGPTLSLLILVYLYAIKKKDIQLSYKLIMHGLAITASVFILSSNFLFRSNDNLGSAFEIRSTLISQSYDLFFNNIIFGAGLGSFENISYLGYPHNLILELLSELGIIGFSVFMLFILSGLIKLRMDFLGLSLLYVLINSLFSGSIANNISVMWFSILCYRVGSQRGKLA